MTAPLTGFETRATANAARTTLSEEATFLTAVATGSSLAEVEVVGTSVQGRPIRALRIGAPGPPSLDDCVAPWLLVGLQHGREPAGREACLQFARDLAFTTDPAWLQYLSEHNVVVMPTVNPDGHENNLRNNMQDLNLNRDHVRLVSPEARAVQSVTRRVRPQIVTDHHEQSDAAAPADADMGWSTNPNVHYELGAFGKAFVDGPLTAALSASGYTTGYYYFPDPLDAPQEGVLANQSGLTHRLGLLVETFMSATMAHRVAVQKAAMRAVLTMHSAQTAALELLLQQSRDRAVQRGQEGGPFDLLAGGSVNLRDGARYILSPEQLAAAAEHLHTFGIASEEDGVTLAQEGQPLLPYLFDPAAPRRLTAGVRTGAPWRGIFRPADIIGVHLEGQTRRVTGLRAAGTTHPIAP